MPFLLAALKHNTLVNRTIPSERNVTIKEANSDKSLGERRSLHTFPN